MAAGSRYSPLNITLLAGLSFLSWISTYTGMMELVAASTGQISLFAQVAIGFAVFMLQLMILYILDALFSGNLRWWLWPTYIVGYIVLFMISVGFAFGFYWKYLEAGAQTTQAAGASVLQVQQALQLGQTRLEQLQSTFTTLSSISTQKAEIERTQGGTCPRSRPGDGPRRRLRDSDAQRFQFANDYIGQRTQDVRNDIASLTADLQLLARNDPSTVDPATGTRAAFVENLERKLGMVETRFNAIRTDPQLRQLRDEFAARAEQTVFTDDRGGTFSCPDPQLQTALNGVVRAIDDLPELDAPQLRSVEGSEAVVEAFRRLTTTAIGIVTQGKLPPSPEELRAARGVTASDDPAARFRFDQESPGLSSRDYIPLMIAIFVDVCILLVSINRPFGPFFNLGESLREARRRGPMQRVFATFYEVFQDSFGEDQRPTPLQLISPVQDVVFDFKGEYYAAVPLDFREENYQEWLKDRRALGEVIEGSPSVDSFDPRNPESYRPLETSRYIASIFAILEGEGLVRLIDAEEAAQSGVKIKDQLNRQGSVYAQADTFRLYRFKKGAWPALLMQVVGSSAEVEETARRRSRRGFFRRGQPQPQLRAPEQRTALPGSHPVEDRGTLTATAIDESARDRALADGFKQAYGRQEALPKPEEKSGSNNTSARDRSREPSES